MSWWETAGTPVNTGPEAGVARYNPMGTGPNTSPPIGLTGPGNPNYNPIAYSTPLQATALPTNYNSAPVDPAIAQQVANYIQSNNLQASQSDPTALNSIVRYLRAQGVNAQVDATDQNGHTGGILVNGAPYQLINGSNQWTSLQPWDQGGGGANGKIPGMSPAYDWDFAQGQKAVQGSAAAKGTLLTGGTLKALTAYGQGMASNEYANDFSRNFQLATLGENAAAQQGLNNSGYANSATNALTNNANAQAAGSIAQGNNAAGTLNNLGAIYQYGSNY